MLSGLRRLFSPSIRELDQLRAEVDQLRTACRQADTERVEVLTEWVRTRDSLARFMKRQGAIRGPVRLPEGEEDEDGEGAEELGRQVSLIRAKFGIGA